MADGGGEASQAPLLFDDSMDIEAYASRYNGRTRLARLLFVAQWYWEDDTKLKALQMAHDEAKEREDTMLYCEAASRINGRLGPLYEYDEAWVYSTKRLVADAEEPAATWTCSECSGDASSPSTAPAPAPTASGGAAGDGGWADLLAALRRIDIDARLSDQDKEQRRKELIGATVCAADATADADEGEEQSALEMVGNNFRCVRCLKRAASMQVSLIEDRIRMSYNEIGDFYYTHGHLDDALKSYKRMNDYSTAPEHILGSYMHIILVYIELGQFQDVLSCVKKAENFVDPLDTISDLKLQTAAALAYMETWQYECAAKKFIEITPALESNYSEVIAPEDAAIYGALCALASFDRSELKSKVIENMNFRNFLEQVPEVRNLVKDFYSRHHQSCLKHLEKLQPNLILDIRLHEHLDTLYKCIHRRMLKAMKKAQKVSARLAYLDLACFHDDVPGPDHLVYMAHLAGRPKLAITGLLAHLAGRFHDVLEQLSTVAESGTDISQKELELYHESYASVLESKLQVIKIFENKLQMNSNDQFLVSYLKKFRMELEETCTAGVKLAEEYLLPAATKQETARVCHNLMAASFYYRFTAELDMKKKNEALSQYLEAKDAASKLTPPFEEGSRTPFEEGSEIPSEEGSEISFEEDATIPFRLYPGQQLTSSNLSSSSDSEGDTAPEVWAADLRKPRS